MRKTLAAWLLFLAAPMAFTAWDAVLLKLSRTSPRALECFEWPTLLVYVLMFSLFVWGTSEMRGGWGTLLRVLLVIGQLWLAMVLQFFILDPIRTESGVYAGGRCADL